METLIKVFYVDPFSLLVVNGHGRIMRLYTPFRVQCIKACGQLPAGPYLYVDAVWQDKKNLLLYYIGGGFYSYSNFKLVLA